MNHDKCRRGNGECEKEGRLPRNSREFTLDQLSAPTELLRSTLAYRNRLLRRMEAERFSAIDKLLRTATEAANRLQHLLTVIHSSGVRGRDGTTELGRRQFYRSGRNW